MADSLGTVRDQLADRPVTAIQFVAATADMQLTTRPVLFCGWSIREASGSAAAAVEILAGGATQGVRVGEQQLNTSLTGSEWLGDEGILCDSGLALHVLSGSVTGCVYVRV